MRVLRGFGDLVLGELSKLESAIKGLGFTALVKKVARLCRKF